MLKTNIVVKMLLITFFFQSLCINVNAFNANDHRIAVLVNHLQNKELSLQLQVI